MFNVLNFVCHTPQEVKEHNAALKVELDLLKEEAKGPHGGKGNSLFGEVEDRRFEAERRLLSLKVKLENLEKTHTVTKQRYSRLKVCLVMSYRRSLRSLNFMNQFHCTCATV